MASGTTPLEVDTTGVMMDDDCLDLKIDMIWGRRVQNGAPTFGANHSCAQLPSLLVVVVLSKPLPINGGTSKHKRTSLPLPYSLMTDIDF